MSHSRLLLALDEALIDLPQAGQIGFLNVPAAFEFPDIDMDRILISQGFFPDHEGLSQRGFTVSPEPASAPDAMFSASFVQCHRSKPATLDLIACAVAQTAPGGLVMVDGPKTDGIESFLKALRGRFEGVQAYSKAHGKLIWFVRPQTLPQMSDWQAGPVRIAGGFSTRAGIFSADHIDKGSALLAENLPPLSGIGLDMGAGWGFLSHGVLQSAAVTGLDLVEADYQAVQMAQLNVKDPRASIHWGDALTHRGSYDFIICNPPFHTSRKADPAIGQSFIRRAATVLRAKGAFWMVANQNLPYEATLDERFHRVETIRQSDGFKVICAQRPKSAR